jgi:hypothetical protein
MRKPRPDDTTLVKLSDTVADFLKLQLLIVPDATLESTNGKIYPKSIGYIYGYVDAFLTVSGYDMSDTEIGPPITFHVLRKVFDLDADTTRRYMEFLISNMRDQTVGMGMMVGGQQFLDYLNKKFDGVAMGLARFILEEKVLVGQ